MYYEIIFNGLQFFISNNPSSLSIHGYLAEAYFQYLNNLNFSVEKTILFDAMTVVLDKFLFYSSFNDGTWPESNKTQIQKYQILKIFRNNKIYPEDIIRIMKNNPEDFSIKEIKFIEC